MAEESQGSGGGNPLRVLISGGGPVGTTVALLLAHRMRENVQVTIYDRRWCRDKADVNRIVWKGEEQNNARRQQVVTIQSRQFQKLPESIRDHVFQPGDYTEMWPLGPDAVNNTPPRNIRIRDVEDRLLDLCNQSEQIRLIPDPFYADSMTETIRKHHLFVIAEGARSSSAEYLESHFGAANKSMYSLGGQQVSDYVLGLRVKSKLPDATSVLLTISQNRFLLNAKKGDGFLNIRLGGQNEVQEVRGFVQEEDEQGRLDRPLYRVVDCIQSSPCLMEARADRQFVCPTHGTIFGPKFLRESKLWPRILEALKLYGIEERDLSAVTGFKLEIEQRSRFTIPLFERSEHTPGVYACLLGDSANAIHFWPGRGLNSGLASAVSLAKCVSSRWRGHGFRDSDFARHEAVMAMLQYRHKTRAWRAMVSPDGAGKLRAIKSIIEGAIAQQPSRAQCKEEAEFSGQTDVLTSEESQKQHYLELMLKRMLAIRERIGSRVEGLPSDESLRQILSKVDAQTLRVMHESGPWDSYSSGGDEVDVDLFYGGVTAPSESKSKAKRRGTYEGRRVVEYDDGTIVYEN